MSDRYDLGFDLTSAHQTAIETLMQAEQPIPRRSG